MRWLTLVLAGMLWVQWASANDKTLIAISEAWEDATNADGTGFYWDMVRAVYEPEGYSVTTDTAPYARAVKMVMSKRADLWCASYEAEEETNYPKTPMDADNVVAIVKKGVLDPAQGTKALDGKRVNWILGYGYNDYIEDAKMDFKEIKSRKIGFNLVESGKIDAFLDSKAEIEAYIEEAKFDMSGYELVPMLQLKMYMAFRPDERGKTLAELWDARVKAMHDSGELKKLYEQHDYTDFYPFQ